MKATKGECTFDKSVIRINNEVIAFTATLTNRVDETRINGESWLDMRHRTEQERIDCELEQLANAELIVDAFNTSNKTGLLPSELLQQRDELLNACRRVNELYTELERMVDGEVLKMLNLVRSAIKSATEQK